MKKTIILLSLGLSFTKFYFAQESYDFQNDPLQNGWTYYDNYNSIPNAGFSFNSVEQALNFNLTTGPQNSLISKTLDESLSSNYCVSFSITPTTNNSNTFFPFLLAADKLIGNDPHPWRMNAVGGSAGDLQNLDIIGIEVFGMQIRFVHRNDNINSNIIQSLSTPFFMEANIEYHIKITVENNVTAIVEVSNTSDFSTILSSSNFSIPALDAMTELYIANGNGNSSSLQNGLLDDYKLSNGCKLNTEPILKEQFSLLFNTESNQLMVSSEQNVEFITIFDLSGKLIGNYKFNENHLDLGFLKSGMYLASIENHPTKLLFVKI